uniref:Nitric oxide synthase-interacting protein n=1 Tax=Myotis myotis TaxID=51298 RepID=A0A7J7QXX9_MYOMY|nr:nitric oxide synthase interacting protein [Myotis myotis]
MGTPLPPVDDAQAGPSAAGPAGKDKDKDKDKMLPSFWIPSLTPEAKATKLEKPSRTVTCPMSGKPLRMSDLTPVRFTPLDSSVDRVGLITRSERYVCAVTRDSLSNATPCAVLRPSGAVVTLECVEKLIRKDMVDPVNGEKLTDRDIIVLQRVSRAPSTVPSCRAPPQGHAPRQATPSQGHASSQATPSQGPASSTGRSLPRPRLLNRPLPPRGHAPRSHSYPEPRPYPRRPAPHLRPRPSWPGWATPPAPRPAFTLPPPPPPGRHGLRGLRSEAAGREVAARDAGLSAGNQIKDLEAAGGLCSAFLRPGAPGPAEEALRWRARWDGPSLRAGLRVFSLVAG